MYQKILVGTDGSATAAKAVDRAVDVARAAGAALTIFSATRPAKGEPVVAAEAQRHAGAGVAIDTKVVDAEPDPEATNGEKMIVFRSIEGFQPPPVELAEAGPAGE